MPIWDTGAEGIYYLFPPPQFSLTVNAQPSVEFSHSVVFNSATHGLQHDRLLCPSPTPEAYSNSCPSGG